MLPMLALSLVVFTQMTVATASDLDERFLRELSELVAAGKKNLDKDRSGHDEKCVQEPIELGLVIDSSSSISTQDFETGLKFLSNLLSEYDIGPGRKQVRVAAVSFGHGVYVKNGFDLTTYTTEEEVRNHVENIPHKHGVSTDTGAALKHMREVLMKNARPRAAQIILVLTDGQSQIKRLTKAEAKKTKEAGITVFAVGVGKAVQEEELLSIAGMEKDHVFQVDSYDDLDEGIKKQLTRKTCHLVRRPPPPPPSPPPPPPPPTCGEKSPADINFIFSAASMGLEEIAFVASVISTIVTHQDLTGGFQYGVVSGYCPDDQAFSLGQLKTFQDIQDHLKQQKNNLPSIVSYATRERFTFARRITSKTAVIFLGKVKVRARDLVKSIKEMLASRVRVFVSTTDRKVLAPIRGLLPAGVRALKGDALSQAAQLVRYLCPFNKKVPEKNIVPYQIEQKQVRKW